MTASSAMHSGVSSSSTTATAVMEKDNSSGTVVKVLQCVVFMTIISISIGGNSLVLFSIYRYRRLRNSLTNYFVASLAFVDLCVSVLVMPFNASLVLNDRVWIFGALVCDLFNANDVMLCTASIAILCCISTDRYIAILHPLTGAHIMTKRRGLLLIGLCWFVSVLISHPLIHTRVYSTYEGLKRQNTQPQSCEFIVNRVYGICSSILSFWIPCFIMSIMYWRIYTTARKQQKRIKALTNRGIMEESLSLEQPLNSRRSNASILHEHKAAWTLGFIMGCFMCCWLPFFGWMTGSNICGQACPEAPGWLVDLLFWIGYFNSSLNPIIVTLCNQEFRRAFVHCLGINSYLQKRKRMRSLPPLPTNARF